MSWRFKPDFGGLFVVAGAILLFGCLVIGLLTMAVDVVKVALSLISGSSVNPRSLGTILFLVFLLFVYLACLLRNKVEKTLREDKVGFNGTMGHSILLSLKWIVYAVTSLILFAVCLTMVRGIVF
jgi:hypothetical protein